MTMKYQYADFNQDIGFTKVLQCLEYLFQSKFSKNPLIQMSDDFYDCKSAQYTGLPVWIYKHHTQILTLFPPK